MSNCIFDTGYFLGELCYDLCDFVYCFFSCDGLSCICCSGFFEGVKYEGVKDDEIKN